MRAEKEKNLLALEAAAAATCKHDQPNSAQIHIMTRNCFGSAERNTNWGLRPHEKWPLFFHLSTAGWRRKAKVGAEKNISLRPQSSISLRFVFEPPNRRAISIEQANRRKRRPPSTSRAFALASPPFVSLPYSVLPLKLHQTIGQTVAVAQSTSTKSSTPD